MTKLLPPNYNVTLEGYSIIMRPIEINDIGEEYASWLNNPEINEFLEVSREKKQTVENIVEYVNKRRSEGTEVFGIVTKYNKKLVGTTGLFNCEKKTEYQKMISLGSIQENSNAVALPLGYGLMIGDKKAQKMGVGGEAYIYMISFIFDVANAGMIFNMAVVNHHEVIIMAERAGFNKLHILKNHIELSDGKYDGIILTMTQDEWTTKKKRFRVLLNRLKIKNGDKKNAYCFHSSS